MRKNYTEKQRNEILQQYWFGVPVAIIAADTGIAKSTLYKWIKATEKEPKAINMSDFRILKQRCETLEKMVEILQISPCTVSAPLHDRYEVIKDLSDTYSISLLCKTLMVAKGSYFNHLKAKEDTVYARKKKEITPIIEEIFNESNQVFGARKINVVLRLRGYTVADKTVAAIMHENGWFSVRGGAKRIYEMTKQRRENILSQEFVATAPNEVWVSDITYFTCKEVKYYICVIIDLYARKVVAYTISKSNGTRLTKTTLTKAYENRHPNEGLIFHSDRGTNYTARTFIDCCKAYGMTKSLSRKSMPYDNSVMEAFFKSLKAEELYRNNYRSEREFRERVGAYIEFYNSKRPHQINRYRTPNAMEESYFKRHSNDAEEI
jgi:transposase InsO family protein